MITFNNKEFNLDANNNWGDNISYDVIKKLSGYESLPMESVFWYSKGMRKNGKIVAIGSVMYYTLENDIVWGTGCIKQGSIGKAPRKVLAVRGPLTRYELLSRDISVPDIYGDPALLIPRIYKVPNVKKNYKYGIIPHYIEYSDKNSLDVIKKLEHLGCKIINICSETEDFINELSDVEIVLSSSLDGLIAADAYGIPNARIKLSNRIIGLHFKFIDYYMSVQRQIDYGTQLWNNVTIDQLNKIKLNDKIKINLDLLLGNAPWHTDMWSDIIASDYNN